MMVVSEMGEPWSPKMEPPNMAPATRGTLTPMLMAMGRAMVAMMAMVPMEVPVAKDSSMEIIKVSSGSRAGVSSCMKMEER